MGNVNLNTVVTNADTVNNQNVEMSIYRSTSSFGASDTDTADAIWKAIPPNSIFATMVQSLTDPSWNFPEGIGYQYSLLMIKLSNVRPLGMYLYPKSGGDVYFANVDANGAYAGNWRKLCDGGNANTLSGHSWTEIFKSNLWASNADCNELTTPGWYSFNGCSGGHAPGTNSTVNSGTYFVMGVIPLSVAGYLIQVATFVHGSVALLGKTYIRYCNNNEWSDWVNIADNGNAALFGGQTPEYYTTPKNLLFNPDFKINQRGQTSYDAVSPTTYTVDRWCTYNGGVTVVPFDDGIKVSNSISTPNSGIFQPLELQRYYSGQKFSVAIYLNENAPEGWYLDLSLYSETGTLIARASTKDIIALKKGVNYVPSVLTVPADGTYYFRVHICNTTTTASTINIRWVNLVEGEHPGHFEYPDPATELARCQRFAFKPGSHFFANEYKFSSDTNFIFEIPCPVNMRCIPSIAGSGSLKLFNVGGSNPVPITGNIGISYNVTSSSGSFIRIQVTTSLQTTATVNLSISSNTIFDAEV